MGEWDSLIFQEHVGSERWRGGGGYSRQRDCRENVMRVKNPEVPWERVNRPTKLEQE